MTCSVRPYPDRCEECPALQWPRHSRRSEGDTNLQYRLRTFAATARCPWDHKGGSVEWEDK